ncbi:MAG: type IV toxin-antitoxin system AbiEi family antitoxin domain-containing protein [Bdellovibrionaceae bacterium]|nr:type IV toxin-antitoxin system AbiEi family antitoxin domain-containing protein [Pseudobdellovibrionaceae bacterium]
MRTNKALNRLLKRPSFTTKEAKELGLSPSLLAYYAKIGTIERVAYGTYRNPKVESSAPFEWHDLLEIANSIPQGTVCLISALSYYGLTQEIQRQYWIAVPNDSKGMRRPKTKIVRMRNVELGRTTIKLGEYKINIFDKERCVVDAFRFLSKESAMYSLKSYLKRTDEHKPDLPKLARYAKELRVDIVPYIEALT